MTEKDLSIEERMRDDWDARVSHDYRYWMSDGVNSDEEMWETGRRDLALLLEGLDRTTFENSIVLEIGCGVGRIVNAAAKIFKQVIGIDVSRTAIETAKKLSKHENLSFYLGNGNDLQPLENNSIDIGVSFASLGSLPSIITAKYILELSRVVKIDGQIRLQVYLGDEQQIPEEDTLALRSYNVDRFIKSLEVAGFDADYIKEVKLPFEVSDYENGVVAYIVGAKKIANSDYSLTEVLEILQEQSETSAKESWQGSQSAHLVALARAKQHLIKNELEEAKSAYSIAMNEYSKGSEEAKIIKIEIDSMSNNLDELLSKNIESGKEVDFSIFETYETIEGNAYKYKGVSLSHLKFPKKAAKAWVERTLSSLKNDTKYLVLVGGGDGYFANALAESFNGTLFLLENDESIVRLLKDRINPDIKIYKSFQEIEELLSFIPEFIALPAVPFYNSELIEGVKARVSYVKYSTTLNPKIGIIGPFAGGTLPIAGYLKNALLSLDKDAHYIDLSGYSSMFDSFTKVLQKKHRQSELENSCIEMISNLVLNIVEERGLDIVISVAQAPLSVNVLEKLKDKGVITVHWFMEDTRRFLSWKSIAKYYDYFYLIQQDESIKEVMDVGGKRVRYLPLACDPSIHTPVILTGEEKNEFGSNVSFVGAGYNNRRHVFAKFSDLDFKIWGTEWPNVTPFDRIVQRSGGRISVTDYVKIFSASKINLNLHSSQERDGIDPSGDFVNPRVFELAACGAFQLTDERKLLPELFEVGTEIITFKDESEIKELIEYYLNSPLERLRITSAARNKVLTEHCYKHRIQEILQQIYSDYGDHLKNRDDRSEWKNTLKKSEKYLELKILLEDASNKGLDPNLECLVSPIIEKNNELSPTELKLLFMHHMKGQITQIQRLRKE